MRDIEQVARQEPESPWPPLLPQVENAFMPTKRLTKTQLVEAIAQETATDKKTAVMFLTAITEIALREVRKNGEFTLPGIGKLIKQKRKARVGRNPKTGESIKIAAKTVVKFRIAKAAKDSLLGTATKSETPAAKKAPVKKTAAKAPPKATKPASKAAPKKTAGR
jgi:DNA-binding protein HU-beta